VSNVLDSVRYHPLSLYHKADLRKLSKDQIQTLLRESRERTACNRHIFLQKENEREKARQVIELEIGQNYAGFRLPGIENGDRGIRGKVHGFSPGARVRCQKWHHSLERYPRIWQDLTFADDVMAGKDTTERAKFSSYILDLWKTWAARHYPGLWGTWKREWKPRKSGSLLGEWCPHFHILLDADAVNPDNWQGVCQDLAIKWVQLTGTSDANGIKVALNGESYRWVKDDHMAQVYVSKYQTKVQELEIGDSLGHFWGKFGSPPIVQKTTKALSFTEKVWLSRYLPKLTRRLGYKAPLDGLRRNKKLERKLAKCSGWLTVRKDTIKRLLDWIGEQPEKQSPGNRICPF